MVSFIAGAGYEPPETATPEPDEELTGVGEAWTPVEEVPEVDEVLPELVGVLAVAPEEVAVLPGMVDALTVPRMPTPARAQNASPAVRRFSILVAASRAWILLSVVLPLSMTPTVARCT
jgi:hypothetical protein